MHQLTGVMLRHAQQQRADPAPALLRMDADEGGELHVISMPDAGEADELLSTVDDDPGIVLQMESVGRVMIFRYWAGSARMALPRGKRCALV